MAREARALPRGESLPRRDYGEFCGDALGAATGDGAMLAVVVSEVFWVAAGETVAAGLVATFGAVVAAGEP